MTLRLQCARRLPAGVNCRLTGLNTPSPAMNEEAMRALQAGATDLCLLHGDKRRIPYRQCSPGKYLLTMDVSDPMRSIIIGEASVGLSKEVLVPDEPNAKVNAPLQIGTLALTIRPRIKIGMGPFHLSEAKTKDGKSWILAKLRASPS